MMKNLDQESVCFLVSKFMGLFCLRCSIKNIHKADSEFGSSTKTKIPTGMKPLESGQQNITHTSTFNCLNGFRLRL